MQFENHAVVQERLEQIASLIRAQDPDLVFLSEAILECDPCPVNQIATLAQATGMHTWAFGENYNFGLPFYRVVGGNAILSRWPLEPVANLSLSGRRPFYITKNNRRALWCAVRLAGQRVLVAALHNDSYNQENNLRQVQQLIDFAGAHPTILAGDFNAEPDSPSLELLRGTGQFAGVPTKKRPAIFPAFHPTRRIDFILVPPQWELVKEHVVDTQVSDHRPVVATYRVR